MRVYASEGERKRGRRREKEKEIKVEAIKIADRWGLVGGELKLIGPGFLVGWFGSIWGTNGGRCLAICRSVQKPNYSLMRDKAVSLRPLTTNWHIACVGHIRFGARYLFEWRPKDRLAGSGYCAGGLAGSCWSELKVEQSLTLPDERWWLRRNYR